MRVKRVDSGPQRTLTKEQVDQLLNSLNTETLSGIRNKAMLLLMLDTGLRANEVCSLQLKRLNLEERTLQVKIKGGDWGEGVFTETTAGWLDLWLKLRDRVAETRTGTVFVSIKGTRPGTSITRDGLRSIFRRMGKKAGLGLISPHDMRRTFATLSIRNGAPTRLVQIAGRWKNIREVERYTRALTASDIDPYSPVNNLGIKGESSDLESMEKQVTNWVQKWNRKRGEKGE
jgi:integrase